MKFLSWLAAGTAIANVAAAPINLVLLTSDGPLKVDVNSPQPATPRERFFTRPCHVRPPIKFPNQKEGKALSISNAFRQAVGWGPIEAFPHPTPHYPNDIIMGGVDNEEEDTKPNRFHILPVLADGPRLTSSPSVQEHKGARILPPGVYHTPDAVNPAEVGRLVYSKGGSKVYEIPKGLWSPPPGFPHHDENRKEHEHHHRHHHKHHSKHSKHHHKPGFWRRIHTALLSLGTWEGRAVAFVLGCGLGVLLRMFFVLTVVLYRAFRPAVQQDTVQYGVIHIYEDAPLEAPIVAAEPPSYPADVKVPVPEEKA